LKPGPSLPRELRLIGGTHKRSKLPVPDRPGLRPTPNRVRETLFNWLGQDLSGWRVLDAFAGSGALGFEAASRGASAVTLLERDPALVAHLNAQCRRLRLPAVAVQQADALRWMAQATPGAFELVLLDPPFGAGLSARAVETARPLLAPGGWLYLEAAAPLASLPPGVRPHRSLRAGAVSAQLLRVDWLREESP
jgi:16S rRNA (guanine(966)-N(2))-methyltransferase RsmD